MTTTSDPCDARLPLPGVNAKHPAFLILLLIAGIAAAASAAEPVFSQPKSEWKSLFNGNDLSGWDKYLSVSEEAGEIVPNRDPKGVFSVTDLNGVNVIRVSGEVYGAITTHDEFTNFHARLEFKWGEKRKIGRASCRERVYHPV